MSRSFKIGERALRLNDSVEPSRWVEFTINKTYLELIKEFPWMYKKLTNE